MICPNCRNEWDVRQGYCQHCGLNAHPSIQVDANRFPDPSLQSTIQTGDFFQMQAQESVNRDALERSFFPQPQADNQARTSTPVINWLEPRISSGDLSPFGSQPGARSISGNLQGSRLLSGGLNHSGPLERNLAGPPPSTSDLPSSTNASRPAFAFPSNQPVRFEQPSGSSSSIQRAVPSASRPLLPGTILGKDRYRLQDLLERQDWIPGVVEATWIGRDLKRGGAQVTICEVVVPDLTSLIKQSNLQHASRALAAAGRDPRVATLREAFSDQGRGFFVFEPIEGDTLLAHLRRLGGPMPEAEVIEFCWQMCEVLDLLARQFPPVAHGLIRPEHVYLTRGGFLHVLGNFSPLIVIGASQFTRSVDRGHLSPYSPQEFPNEIADVRSDLYSLLATAYHAATGSMPKPRNMMVTPARQLNPHISPMLDNILTRGLQPQPQQRYQSPFELRQDLLAARTFEEKKAFERVKSLDLGNEQPFNNLSSGIEQNQPKPVALPPVQPVAPSSSYPFPIPLLEGAQLKPAAAALPQPGDLPPLREGNNYLAIIEAAAILVILILITMLSNYHL